MLRLFTQRVGLSESMEVSMAINEPRMSRAAILTLAEIKSATEAFDSGESSVFDALHRISSSVEAYQAAARAFELQTRGRRKAA